MRRKKRNGLYFLLVWRCDCGYEKEFENSKKNENKIEEINMRIVYGMRCIGIGMNGIESFLGMMNLPKFCTKIKPYEDELKKNLKIIAEESMNKWSMKAIKNNNNNNQVTISIDGTYITRGYSSKSGMVLACDPYESKIIDYLILTR